MANNIRILITADDKASKPIRQISDELDNSSKSSQRFASIMKGAGKVAFTAIAAGTAAATAGLMSAAKASYDQVKAVEEARFGLMAYEKDGKKVEKVLGDLVAYAQSDMGVLFNRKDMFAAASTLKMYGNATDSLGDRVKILSKGVAQGKTSFQELSAIVGRAAAKGKLDAVDFDMLIERGIGLDRSFRGSTVSADKLWKALDKALPDELLKGRAETIEGRMIRLQSAFRGVGNEVLGVDSKTNNFIEGGLGDRFMKGVGTATTLLKDMAPVIGDIVTGFLDFTDSVRDKFIGSIDAGRDAIKWMGDRLNDLSDFVSETKKAFIKFKDDGITAVNGVIDGSKKVWEDFTGWIEDNEGAIKGVATTLGVIFGPALVQAGVLATIQGAKIAGAGIAAGAGWITGSVAAAAAWAVNAVRMGALSAGIYALMLIDAAKSGAAWVAGAVTASAAWVVHMAKTSAAMVATAIVASVRAADAGWAWVFNAARASFAWVTQELPKIVWGFVVTSTAATTQAAVASWAWITNASKSAVAWVVTQLPRIVAGFVTTSASAVAQAAVTTGAWVASASKSAAAWVVTQLPRIIAAFVVMSASSVAHAAVASGAWVASAATSSLAVKGLAALVATPMVMPAIVIAAALGALGLVISKARETAGVVRDVAGALEENKKSSANTELAMRKLRDQGKISTDQLNQYLANTRHNAALAGQNLYSGFFGPMNRSLDNLMVRITGTQQQYKGSGFGGHAQGTNYSPGGMTLVGERGPELVNLPRGSQVMQAYRTRQTLSEGSTGGDTNITISGNININSPEAADAFWNRVDKTQRLAKVGMA